MNGILYFGIGTILYLPLNDCMQLMPNYIVPHSAPQWHMFIMSSCCDVVVSHWRHLWILFWGALDEFIRRTVFEAVVVLWLYLQVSYAATEQVRWPTAHLALAWITGTHTDTAALPTGTNRKRSVKAFCRYFTPGKVLDAGLIIHGEQSTSCIITNSTVAHDSIIWYPKEVMK